MAYQPPTLADLRPVIFRSLRDPEGKVFSADNIDDFINEGLSDLSQFRPVEDTVTAVWDSADITPDTGDLDYIWHVELLVPDTPQYLVPPNEQGYPGRTGWEFYDNRLRFGAYWVSILNGLLEQGREPQVEVWGYRPRNLPTSDDDVLDFQQSVDEMAVRKYARLQGFTLLSHDRSLYQQWLAATNNTDVSPTQLQGMLAQSTDEYERFRKRSAILRRTSIYPSYTT